MATAIDALQPEWVVIENVRGLLSAPATRPSLRGDENAQRKPEAATLDVATLRDLEPDPWGLGDQPARPLRALGAVLGDLADLRYDAQWIGLPASAIGAPHPRFRIFILARHPVPDTTGVGLRSGRRVARPGTGSARNDRTQSSSDRPRSQLRQPFDRANTRTDRGAIRGWGRYAPAVTRWERVIGRSAPAPALVSDHTGLRPNPIFVEWLMGLDDGWVTNPALGLTSAQQLTALGNGVAPAQAIAAISALLTVS